MPRFFHLQRLRQEEQSQRLLLRMRLRQWQVPRLQQVVYCPRLGVVNFNDKILSPGGLVEIEANLHKVSEIERGCQDSKDVGENSQDLSGGSI